MKLPHSANSPQVGADQASKSRALSRHPSPPSLQPPPRGSPLLHPRPSQGAESVSCQGGVGTSLCHLAGGSTCPCTVELGLLLRVWLSLAGTTQAVQTVATTVHVTIQAAGYLGLSAPSAHSQAPHGAPTWGWCRLALLPSPFSLRKPGLSMTCEATGSLTHHFLAYMLNLENWLEGTGSRKGLEELRQLARGTF